MASRQFLLPELGENIESADVVDVLVSVGDTIEKNQNVVVIETDKATLEVPTDVGGTVRQIHVKKGGRVSVGDPVFTVEVSEPAVAERPPEPEKPLAVEREEPPRKVAVEVGPGEVASDQDGRGARPAEKPWTPRKGPAVEEVRRVAPAGPAVRRVARELGLDVDEVPGSGPGGRITLEDIKAHARRVMKRRREAPPGAPAAEAPPLPDFTRWGEVRRERLSNIRRATARAMARSWALAPRVTQHDRADITELEAARRRFAPRVEKAGGKLTLTAMLVKVVASALKVFPRFNASLDLEADEIIYKEYRHIGVAVDTPQGLLVPVIRDADRKNLLGLAVELGELVRKARSRKLQPEEMQGASFTITNLGGIGGTSFTPIVNWPEVAILGVARARIEPIYRDGTFQPRTVLPLCLSYDHRLLDGADGARFVRWIAEALENPFQLLLEG